MDIVQDISAWLEKYDFTSWSSLQDELSHYAAQLQRFNQLDVNLRLMERVRKRLDIIETLEKMYFGAEIALLEKWPWRSAAEAVELSLIIGRAVGGLISQIQTRLAVAKVATTKQILMRPVLLKQQPEKVPPELMQQWFLVKAIAAVPCVNTIVQVATEMMEESGEPVEAITHGARSLYKELIKAEL